VLLYLLFDKLKSQRYRAAGSLLSIVFIFPAVSNYSFFCNYSGLPQSAGAIKRAATNARTSSKVGLVVDFEISFNYPARLAQSEAADLSNPIQDTVK
jgi:hypothetical protein